MKIYFACSVRGGRDDKDIYAQIVRFLTKRGEVLSEFNVDKDLTPFGTPGSTDDTYNRDIEMLSQSEVMIAEVSTPSLGVGYEIAKAEEMGLPVLALYRPSPGKNLSAMIAGSPKVSLAEYNEIYQAKQAVDEFLETLN